MQAEEVRKLRAENARLREEKAEMVAMLQSAQAALASVSRDFSTYVGQVCLVTSTRCSRDSII
jgi:transposase-like protein